MTYPLSDSEFTPSVAWVANRAASSEWNESETKERETNKELEWVQLSSREKNDRDCGMRGMRNHQVCEKK
jgi:hypothetical protein